MADTDGPANEPVGLTRGRTEVGIRQRVGTAPRSAQPRSTADVRRTLAPIEFTFDLRETPPDKVLGRLFAGLDRISGDVTLLVLLRDTPELVGVTANAFHLLRTRGYSSDMSRLPSGGQRLTIRPGTGGLTLSHRRPTKRPNVNMCRHRPPRLMPMPSMATARSSLAPASRGRTSDGLGHHCR